MESPIPDPDLKAQHALAPLVESAAELVTQDDLIRLAEQLAAQFKWDPWSAELGTVSWYQEQVAGAVCTEERADLLRSITIYRCLTAHQRRLMLDPLRDFGMHHVPDEPANRERRATLMASLPGRRLAPIAGADDDVPISLMADDTLLEPGDLRGIAGVGAGLMLIGLMVVGVVVLGVCKAASWMAAR